MPNLTTCQTYSWSFQTSKIFKPTSLKKWIKIKAKKKSKSSSDWTTLNPLILKPFKPPKLPKALNLGGLEKCSEAHIDGDGALSSFHHRQVFTPFIFFSSYASFLLLLLPLPSFSLMQPSPPKKTRWHSYCSKIWHNVPIAPKIWTYSNDDNQDGEDDRTMTTMMMTKEGVNDPLPPPVNGCQQPNSLKLKLLVMAMASTTIIAIALARYQ